MRKPWTNAELQYLINHYANDSAGEISLFLDRPISSVYTKANELKLKKSDSFYASDKSGRLNGSQGESSRFKKGQVSWNKGKKIKVTPAMESTFFKKGNKPHNTKHNGFISTRGDYKWIRIKERHWKQLHRYTWEQNNGPIPEGFNIVFRDGNSLNCDIDNLMLVSNEELMRANTIMNYPEDLRDTMRTLGRLKQTIRKHGEE